MEANFYVAITSNSHGMSHLVTGPHNRVLYYVKVGDTALINDRVKPYYTSNPDVSEPFLSGMIELNSSQVALFSIQIVAYDVLDIRTDANVRHRLEFQYNTAEIEALYAQKASKVVEKCVFGPEYGRALQGKEWFGVVDRENELRNLFPQSALFENRIGIVCQTVQAFINELFDVVGGYLI